MKHIMTSHPTSFLTAVQNGDIQPNAVDLRLGRVFRFKDGYNVFRISENDKMHRHVAEIEIKEYQDYFVLQEGSYQITFANTITVGPDDAGWVITRSTLIRNGVYIVSGLYDSGYSGSMAALLRVTGGTAQIEKGVRIGQYLNFAAEALHMYDGSYGVQNENQ